MQATWKVCPHCATPQPPSPPSSPSSPTAAFVKCSACNGSGICWSCNGTRVSKKFKLIGAYPCESCPTIEGLGTSASGQCSKCNGTGNISRSVYDAEQERKEKTAAAARRREEKIKAKEFKKTRKLQLLYLDELKLAKDVIGSTDFSGHQGNPLLNMAKGCVKKVEGQYPRPTSFKFLPTTEGDVHLFKVKLSKDAILGPNKKIIVVSISNDYLSLKRIHGKPIIPSEPRINSSDMSQMPLIEMSEKSIWHGVYQQISFGGVKIPYFEGLCAYFVCIRHYFSLLSGSIDNTLEQAIVELEKTYL